MRELIAALGAHSDPTDVFTPALSMSEAGVQARVRLAASQAGMRVWRNNVGAVHDPLKNIHVRFGLANDSPQMNDKLKSADLIGIRPRLIGPSDVGTTIGQFVSFEVKHAGWRWRGDEHEQAQAAWAALVISLGGDARFVSDSSQV
jgi:hypothetical protein